MKLLLLAMLLQLMFPRRSLPLRRIRRDPQPVEPVRVERCRCGSCEACDPLAQTWGAQR